MMESLVPPLIYLLFYDYAMLVSLKVILGEQFELQDLPLAMIISKN